jgi:hypothetical protein
MTRPLKFLQIAICVAAASWTLLAALSAHAAFHLWKIDEVFSNSDGTVQFIELTDGSIGEQFVSGHPLSSATHTVTPSSNLPAVNNMTAGHHMLFATAGFGSLAGGVTPDYIIPANFFNKAGDTLNWASGFDIKTFGAVPTDGIHSLLIPSGTSAISTPTSFVGTGDYNHNKVVDAADYTVWRDTLGQSVTAGSGADGYTDGTIDSFDFSFWVSKFGTVLPGAGSGAATAVPEPVSILLLICGIAAACVVSAKSLRHKWTNGDWRRI